MGRKNPLHAQPRENTIAYNVVRAARRLLGGLKEKNDLTLSFFENSSSAVPSKMAACASCPQLCIGAGIVDRGW
ncbi:hypothetical protein A6X20_38695 [Bradyrhizobium elkanii]|nr:hypothetical protein A6X20_38695 [Bradyrhizobium elkanii]ODM76883.1 hypothetical protein A6452_01625 [Bradyrhizobium elkanii]